MDPAGLGLGAPRVQPGERRLRIVRTLVEHLRQPLAVLGNRGHARAFGNLGTGHAIRGHVLYRFDVRQRRLVKLRTISPWAFSTYWIV